MATLGMAQTGFVINEINYDDQGTDVTEYVELYNGSGQDISLAHYQVVFINGSNNLPYTTINLGALGTLPSHHYLVIADSMVQVPSSALKIYFPKLMDNIQNGAPDGLALVDTLQKKVIDALSYEGSILTATITGFSGTYSLVEGNPTDAQDNNTIPGSLVRSPNGQDTDDAKTDWIFSSSPSPGIVNDQIALDISNTSTTSQNDPSFYPNPSQHGLFYIKNLAEMLEVTDAYGHVLTEVKLLNGTLDLSTYNKGVYLVKMQWNDRVWQQKLVVQ
jgi:hypothetical protein